MGTLGTPEMAGIYIPQAEIGQTRVGITNQFLEDASLYHEKYSNTDYFKSQLARALSRLGELPASPRILDIGSGSGNTVFPCLELFPDCSIVATDLSPNLLKILFDHAEGQANAAGRLVPVCMDATRDYYQPGSFDLVIGAAILHHLIDPEAAIRAAGRALAPGGHAIFFEPFESGMAILRLAYSEILARDEANKQLPRGNAKDTPRGLIDRLLGRSSTETPRPPELPHEVWAHLKQSIQDWTVRSGIDKSHPFFQILDDKWLFTRAYLEPRAKAAGFDELTLYSMLDVTDQFRRQTEVLLQLSIGVRPDALPDWAWQILDSYDRLFSAELKQELLIEGAIILTKR